MGADVFTKSRKYLTAASIELLDFSKFLQMYIHYAGLIAPSFSKIAATVGTVPFWVPSSEGLWIEVSLCKQFLLFNDKKYVVFSRSFCVCMTPCV